MKEKDSFSTGRLFAQLRYDFANNRQRLAIFILSAVATTIFIKLSLPVKEFRSENIIDNIITVLFPTVPFVSAIFVLIATARSCTDIIKKEHRIAYIMLPCTAAEKFISRVVGTVAAIVAAILASAIVTFAVFLIQAFMAGTLYDFFNIFADGTVRIFSDNPMGIITKNIVESLNIFSTILLLYSLATLGGIYYSKWPTFKCAIMSLLMLIAVANIIYTAVYATSGHYPEQTTIIAAFTVATVICWCIGYRQFKRISVTKHKELFALPMVATIACWIICYSIRINYDETHKEERALKRIARVERASGVTLPEFIVKGEITEGPNFLGDYGITTKIEFNEIPGEDFLQKLDSLTIAEEKFWRRFNDGYLYSRIWGNNTGTPPPGENAEADIFMNIRIYTNSREAEVEFGIW